MRPGLINTFTHVLSPGAEERIWNKGLYSWRAYEGGGAALFSEDRRQFLLHRLAASRRALKRRSASFFLKDLRAQYRVRPLADFLDEAVCLDLETDGLGPEAAITTASTYDGKSIRLYIRGINLECLVDELRRARLMITFNGTRFDLPILRRTFGWNGKSRHLDLMPVLNALGYRGSLKAIEAARGMVRPPGLARTGLEAVEFWARFQRGDQAALRALLAYNAADAAGLLPLAAWAWLRSWDGFPVRIEGLHVASYSEAYRKILDRVFFDNGILPLVVD